MPTLRYPTKIAGILRPAGTVVENVPPDDPWLRSRFPTGRANADSPMACVRVPGETDATIVLVSQLVIE